MCLVDEGLRQVCLMVEEGVLGGCLKCLTLPPPHSDHLPSAPGVHFVFQSYLRKPSSPYLSFLFTFAH